MELKKIAFNFAVLCRCADGEGDPGAAHPPPGAGEGQRVVQGLLQPLHHLPQNQDAQRQPTQERPGGALLPQPLLHQPPPPGNALKSAGGHRRRAGWRVAALFSSLLAGGPPSFPPLRPLSTVKAAQRLFGSQKAIFGFLFSFFFGPGTSCSCPPRRDRLSHLDFSSSLRRSGCEKETPGASGKAGKDEEAAKNGGNVNRNGPDRAAPWGLFGAKEGIVAKNLGKKKKVARGSGFTDSFAAQGNVGKCGKE